MSDPIVLPDADHPASTVKLSARQLASQHANAALQPELKSMQKNSSAATRAIARRVSGPAGSSTRSRASVRPPAASRACCRCGMPIPLYSVHRIGLTNFDPNAMLTVFGQKVVPLTCRTRPICDGRPWTRPCRHQHRHRRASTWARSRSSSACHSVSRGALWVSLLLSPPPALQMVSEPDDDAANAANRSSDQRSKRPMLMLLDPVRRILTRGFGSVIWLRSTFGCSRSWQQF